MQQANGLDADIALATLLSGQLAWSTDSKEFTVGDGATVGGIPLRQAFARRVAKTGAYTVVAADARKTFDATANTWTLTLTAAAALGNGFSFTIFNSGSGVITIDANASETIRDAASSAVTKTLAQGEAAILTCDASGWFMMKFAAGGLLTQGTGLVVTDAGFRGVPQNSQSAAYTLVAADAGKHIYHPSADTTARIWTIPANSSVAYEIGTAITFINDTSGGVITIAITTDTLVLAGTGTTGSRTLAANGIATAVKMTATRWMISGTGLT